MVARTREGKMWAENAAEGVSQTVRDVGNIRYELDGGETVSPTCTWGG